MTWRRAVEVDFNDFGGRIFLDPAIPFDKPFVGELVFAYNPEENIGFDGIICDVSSLIDSTHYIVKIQDIRN